MPFSARGRAFSGEDAAFHVAIHVVFQRNLYVSALRAEFTRSVVEKGIAVIGLARRIAEGKSPCFETRR